ncbi:MAG: hypothetical protein AB2A00_37060 [Myxococcota bacterium]
MKLRVFLVVVCAVASAGLGCTTVKVATTPPDARVHADGEDISDQRELQVGPGFADQEITVSRDGYRSRKVVLPRDQMHPGLKVAALLGSLGCAMISASNACCLAATFTGRGDLRTQAGFCVGNGGLSVLAPLVLLIGVFTLQALTDMAAPWSMLCAMGGCSLLGSWPLLGLLVPAVLPVPRNEVTVELERLPDAAAPAPAGAPSPPSAGAGKPASATSPSPSAQAH